jgi:hypothetical protein
LSAAGEDVIGLDCDPAMLAIALRRRSGARLVAADMRRFALHHRFGTVLIPYNSIQLLTDPKDQRACLATAAAHLAEGGVVGLEVTDFQAGATQTVVSEEVLYTGPLDGSDGGDADEVTLIGDLTHDFVHRMSVYHRRFVGAGWLVDDERAIRSLNRSELGDLLAASGLVPHSWWQQRRVTRVVATRSPALSSAGCHDLGTRGPS